MSALSNNSPMLPLINNFAAGNYNGDNLDQSQIMALLGYFSGDNSFGVNNSVIEYLNTLLQQRNRDQDLLNSDPRTIAEKLQSMGMSRAAALQAVSGTQMATTQVSPQSPTNPDFSPLVQGASALNSWVGTIASLSQLPFDNRVKAVTAELIHGQSQLLTEQREGMSLASAAVQAATNNEFQYENKSASDLLQFLSQIQDAAPLVQSIKRNPYAYSSLTQMMSADYAARAESYEPKAAESRMLQQNALAQLSQNDADNIDLMNNLLSNQVYIDNIQTALRQAVEYAKANNDLLALNFDSQRLESLLQHIRDFTSYDYEQIVFQLNEIKMMNNDVLRKERLKELTESAKFNAAQAIYGFSMTNLLQQTYDNTMMNPDLRPKLYKAARKYMYGVSLGGYESQNNARSWFSAGTSAVGAVAAGLFAGYKIFGPKVVTPPLMNGFTFNSPTYYTTGGLQ